MKLTEGSGAEQELAAPIEDWEAACVLVLPRINTHRDQETAGDAEDEAWEFKPASPLHTKTAGDINSPRVGAVQAQGAYQRHLLCDKARMPDGSTARLSPSRDPRQEYAALSKWFKNQPPTAAVKAKFKMLQSMRK